MQAVVVVADVVVVAVAEEVDVTAAAMAGTVVAAAEGTSRGFARSTKIKIPTLSHTTRQGWGTRQHRAAISVAALLFSARLPLFIAAPACEGSPYNQGLGLL